MPITVVLAVGLDSWFLSTNSALWKSQGFVMISVDSAREAIDHFNAGDFDLVLLSDSVPAEQRERLTFLIRARGSRTPVVCVSDSFALCESSAACESPAEVTSRNDPGTLLSGLKDLLHAKGSLLASPAVI